MLFTIFRKEVRDMNALFNGYYIEVKAFYAWQFNRVPCVHFISELDVTKAYAHISERYKYSIANVYQYAWYDHKEGKMLFSNSILVLKDDRMIELANDYCQVLFAPHQYPWAAQLIKDLVAFRKAERKEVRVMGFARQPETN
jgi:hypothetical protein